jgi:hypothetical protein
MRGGVAPPALLIIALGLALAFAPRNTRLPSCLLLLVVATSVVFLPIPQTYVEGVFLGCWVTVIVTAGSVHFTRGLSRAIALALSLNVGLWAGAVVSLSGSRSDLVKALPCVLIYLPASWTIARFTPIPVKVVGSWVIATAVLAATLQFIPVTPGYLPDHME